MFLSIVVPLLLGIPLSIYSGFISARIMTFQEHRNRAAALTSQVRHAFTKKEALVRALEQAEEIRMCGLLLLEAGHKQAGHAMVGIGEDFVQTLKEKIAWRDGITERNANWNIFTPVFSDEKIAQCETIIKEAKMAVGVILSPSIRV